MSMLTNDWSLALKDEFNKPYYRDLYRFVKEEIAQKWFIRQRTIYSMPYT